VVQGCGAGHDVDGSTGHVDGKAGAEQAAVERGINME